MLNESKITIKDDRGQVLDSHGQPISVVVEIQKANEAADSIGTNLSKSRGQ